MELVHNFSSFRNQELKIIRIGEDPWICGKDICDILQYKDIKKALQNNVKPKHKKALAELTGPLKEVGEPRSPTSFNEGKAVYISESGLYHLISKCSLPIATEFQDWVFEEALPAFRKSTVEIKDKALAESMAALAKSEEDKEKLERYTLSLKDMLVNMKARIKDQFVYIATTRQYALRNRFKVGGVKNINLLKGRLSQYNTGRPQGDKMYYAFIIECVDYRHLETRIDKIIGNHKDTAESEVYILHYLALKDMIQYLAERFDDEVKMHCSIFNKIVKDTIYQEPFVPDPLIINGAEYRSIKNGIQVSTQVIDWDTMDREAKLAFVSTVIEEYVDSEKVTEDTVLQRKEFENYLTREHGAKFNKKTMWTFMRDVSKEKGYKIKY